jgi:uncharacterized membrane-anchored protein
MAGISHWKHIDARDAFNNVKKAVEMDDKRNRHRAGKIKIETLFWIANSRYNRSPR